MLTKVSSDLKRAVEIHVNSLLSKQIDSAYTDAHLLLPPPSQEEAQGPYPLGEVRYGKEGRGYTFGLKEEDWIRHVTVTGISGAGKSNLGFIMLKELTQAGKPFMLLDWKRSSRNVLATDWGKNVSVFTVGRSVNPFYFNPLIPPPGVEPTTWVKKLIEVIENAFYVGFGVAFILQQAIEKCYHQYGVYDLGADAAIKGREFPVWYDVMQEVTEMSLKGRKANWRDSAERAVYLLTTPELNKVVNVRVPLPFDELVKRRIILEMENLAIPERVFFIDSLLLWLYHSFLSQGTEREKHFYTVLIEEAHHIVQKKKADGEESVVDHMLRQFRELGVGIILFDQFPSYMSIPALSAATSITFGLKHKSDIDAMASAALLDTSQRRFLGELAVGEAIVKQQGRYPKPFLIQVPYGGIEKGQITDEMIREFTQKPERIGPGKALAALQNAAFGTPYPGINGGKKGEFQKPRTETRAAGPQVSSYAAKSPRVQSKSERRFAGELVRMLADVQEHEDSTFLERTKRLLFSGYMADKVKAELVRLRLVDEQDDLSDQGRRFKRLTLTPKGLSYLGARRSELKKARAPGSRRHGGPEHQQAIQKMKDKLEAEGWTCQIERPLGGGRAVDLHAEKPGRLLAVEVETGSAREGMVHNIQKCLKAGYHEVWSVGTKESVAEQIRRDAGLGHLKLDERVTVADLDSLVV